MEKNNLFNVFVGQRIIEPSLRNMFKSDHQKRPLGSFTLADLGGGAPMINFMSCDPVSKV